MRRIFLSALATCPAFAEISAAAGADSGPFEPQPLVLTPDPPPQFPMPEKFGGEPLPSPDEKAALVQQALQLATPPPAAPDEAAQRAKIAELFSAVADGNQSRVNTLLDEGLDPDTPLPRPADSDFVARFDGSYLHYFVTVEPGLTPLMLAAGRGDDAMLRLLLARGASPKARTKRHKTFPLWLAGKGGHVAAMQTLLGVTSDSDAARTLVEIDLAAQTATLTRDGAPGEAVPISTGRKGFPTRAGEYVVTDKHRKWRSTLYPADMPYFMRLSCGEIGLHQGNLPGYPASHGCIRLRQKDAAKLFKQVPVGTKVIIK
ncbi:MAG: L,D-transpeptidase family protein [Chthoniobacterales bacterium]